jgi:hypothetical protein
MENVKNLKVICQLEDGAYNCTVDMFDTWAKAWDDNVSYVARRGDPAPVNVWIIEQIATGSYNPIDACPIPPPETTQPFGDAGPSVA